jgi:hypothetical protein
MFLSKTKWLTLTVAVCFAILQALQPFIHGHLDADHPIQHTGFHVGDAHEETVSSNHEATHTVSNVPHASHTVSVASGIKQDFENMPFIDVLFAAILSFCFVLTLQSNYRFKPALLSIPKESIKRRLPASRAPPQF